MAGAQVSCPNCEETITVPGSAGPSSKRVVVKKGGSGVKKQITRSKSPASGVTLAPKSDASSAVKVPKKKKASLKVTAEPDYTPTSKSSSPSSDLHNDFMPHKMIVTDVQITFGRMVVLILKWSLASIPAMIILWIIMFAIMAAFSGVIAAIFSGFGP